MQWTTDPSGWPSQLTRERLSSNFLLLFGHLTMVNEDAIRQTSQYIRDALRKLACELENGRDISPLVWVIPGKLACAHRPLRYHQKFGGSRRQLPPEAAPEVLKWVARIVNEGIRSVICLMHPKEIQHYAALDLGAPDILALYRQHGLLVCHLPWDDPAHRPSGSRVSFRYEVLRVREDALACFDCLTKPTLIHCSAGQDRSAPVAAYIQETRHK